MLYFLSGFTFFDNVPSTKLDFDNRSNISFFRKPSLNPNRPRLRLPYKLLEIKSPYNTYRYRGLPPGPIGNPGQAALEAAVNPANGQWLYYVTVKPSDTRFTKSYDEFLVWVSEFKKNEKAGLFND